MANIACLGSKLAIIVENIEFLVSNGFELISVKENLKFDSSNETTQLLNGIKLSIDIRNSMVSNNPYGEKDFGAFDFKGKKIFWKIDYYDNKFLFLSPNACKPKLTNRVMTIMYADEY